MHDYVLVCINPALISQSKQEYLRYSLWFCFVIAELTSKINIEWKSRLEMQHSQRKTKRKFVTRFSIDRFKRIE